MLGLRVVIVILLFPSFICVFLAMCLGLRGVLMGVLMGRSCFVGLRGYIGLYLRPLHLRHNFWFKVFFPVRVWVYVVLCMLWLLLF